MEDIVAVEVQLDTGDKRYFLTWGRIQSPVETEQLEAIILRCASRFALGGIPASARVCRSLQPAATQPYFYECFFLMCQARIPFGPRYRQWARKIAEAMEEGKELYYLGDPSDSKERGSGVIAYGKDGFP